MSGVGAGVGLASLLALAGCGAEPQGPADGDCNARITYQNRTFRLNNLVNDAAPTGHAVLGTGDVIDCDRRSVDRAVIHEVRGVDPKIAIAVTDQAWRGVYVREGTTAKDWPALVEPAPSR